MYRLFSLLLISLLTACTTQRDAPPQRPNIVFFLVDDMGWMDSSVYGSQYYDTPNMERLARMGMTFTRAYAANPLCSPTRASILTGKHPGRFGMTTPAGHLPPNPEEDLRRTTGAPWQKVVQQGIRTFLPLEEFTLAEALQRNGYRTAHMGKWHLGQRGYWPEQQGFDVNVGGMMHPGPPSYFAPYRIANLPEGGQHEYITDRLTIEATNFLDTIGEQPFFLNLWHFGVHAPYQAPLDLIAKYEGRTDPRGKQSSPIMGGMMEKVDESLGSVLDKLEEKGLLDNTIFVFFSDNGGNMYDVVNGSFPTNNYPLSYGKGNIYEGGIRVPAIVAWPGRVAAGATSDALIQSIDFYPTLLAATGTPAEPTQLLDGVDLLPHLTRGTALKREAIFSHFPHYVIATNNLPSTAVWYDHYKLVKEYGEGPDRTPALRLYDLERDISETTDLADQQPALVTKLAAMIKQHVAEIGGLVPVINPAYDPAAESPMGRTKTFPSEKYPNY
ncbi:Arylsulfatase [Neolewinella maritima]|uniref:Arylsulfatase n=1 Tax=Neolewinella maritima TaxID=1383882 RepID=A0ABM9B3F5_9BACT|nr:sulfatase [Neolewinella maritima]CAH1001858.1 Arylsulfatase [Neolewinella maritima]